MVGEWISSTFWVIGSLAALFAALYWGGGTLAAMLEGVWGRWGSAAVAAAVGRTMGRGLAARIVLWGLDGGVQALISVGIPYVLAYYLVFAVLQETGVVARVAAAADRLLVRTGLSATPSLPLVMAAGCNVPALLALRALPGGSTRIVAGTLVTLVPCGARTAVIFGTVGAALGAGWAAALYGVVAAVLVGTGGLLRVFFPTARLSPPPPGSLRCPSARAVTRTVAAAAREFLFGAAPAVMAGSLALGALYETGAIRLAARPLSPVVEGWLLLPPAAGLTLLCAMLRKELAVQLLTALGTMTGVPAGAGLREWLTPAQIFTYALVNTLALPCLATVGVLARVVGTARAAGVVGLGLGMAVLLGGAAARLLAAL
ncbi:MAG: nucleoside recognition domain-containing protein [Armatimonadota bacterium]|nr:nucleoside recognition domain-containing protein [Armatimonadota bacterium]